MNPSAFIELENQIYQWASSGAVSSTARVNFLFSQDQIIPIIFKKVSVSVDVHNSKSHQYPEKFKKVINVLSTDKKVQEAFHLYFPCASLMKLYALNKDKSCEFEIRYFNTEEEMLPHYPHELIPKNMHRLRGEIKTQMCESCFFV